MNNKTLTKLFSAIGKRFGYDDVTAEFAPFRDFKVKWTRSYKWITLEVSDYLDNAPEGVMKSMAETIFQKIKGEKKHPYPENVCGWLTDSDFVRRNQPVFIRRYRGLSTKTQGRSRDLSESYDRLVSMGLVERDPAMYAAWASTPRSPRAGRSSVLMKVVVISDMLDDAMVPERVLDYCMYSQLAHVAMGFDPMQESRGPEYDAMLSRFPDRAGVENHLRRMGLYI